jgi:hypothetical protein
MKEKTWNELGQLVVLVVAVPLAIASAIFGGITWAHGDEPMCWGLFAVTVSSAFTIFWEFAIAIHQKGVGLGAVSATPREKSREDRGVELPRNGSTVSMPEVYRPREER